MLKIKLTKSMKEQYSVDCTNAAISHNEEELWAAGYTRVDLFEATQDRLLHYDGACIGFDMGERLCFAVGDWYVSYDGRVFLEQPSDMTLSDFAPARRYAIQASMKPVEVKVKCVTCPNTVSTKVPAQVYTAWKHFMIDDSEAFPNLSKDDISLLRFHVCTTCLPRRPQ